VARKALASSLPWARAASIRPRTPSHRSPSSQPRAARQAGWNASCSAGQALRGVGAEGELRGRDPDLPGPRRGRPGPRARDEAGRGVDARRRRPAGGGGEPGGRQRVVAVAPVDLHGASLPHVRGLIPGSRSSHARFLGSCRAVEQRRGHDGCQVHRDGPGVGELFRRLELELQLGGAEAPPQAPPAPPAPSSADLQLTPAIHRVTRRPRPRRGRRRVR
jgi:hypothetical protein